VEAALPQPLHDVVRGPAGPAEFIANSEPTVNCAGVWVKASVSPDGRTYTVQIGEDGTSRTYQTRGARK
jgi:hypothetical protein